MRLLLALVGCQVLGNALGSPLNKAIELIEGLKTKVEADGVKQEEAYKKYKDWCETQSAELLREVETQKKSADKAAADIYEAEAAYAASAAAVEKLAAQVARAEEKLQSAKDARDEDHKAFKATEISLTDTISTLDKAAEAVSGSDADKKRLALQQMSSEEANHATDMLLGLAAIVGSDSTNLPALLQGQGMEDDTEGMGGMGGMQNQDLLDLLQRMSKEAEKNLAELRKKEEGDKRSHELLTASLKRGLDEDGRSLSAEKDRQRAANVLKAKLQGDRTGAAKGIETVQTTLKTTQDACMQAAADEEASGTGRRQELQVLAEAAKVLKGAAEGVSFLQLSSRSTATRRIRSSSSKMEPSVQVEEPRDEPETPGKGNVVVKLLGRLAKHQQLPVLAQLAGRISTALRTTRGDPLAAVRKMVQDLILKMQDQMVQEASEEAYCKAETSRSEARIKSLQNTLDTAQSEIDISSSSSAVLGAEIDKRREELEGLAKEQAQMTSALDEMKEDYEKSKVDLQKGLDGIQAALEKLQTYYGGQPALIQKNTANGVALAQVEPESSSKEVEIMAASMDMDMSQEETASNVPHEEGPPNSLATRAAEAVAALQEVAAPAAPAAPTRHVASSGAGNGIIQMLQVCESRLADNLAQLETQSSDQQMQQKELMKQNQILKNQKELEVEHKTKDKNSADAEARRLTEELESAKNELQPLKEYYTQIKERCDKRTSREEIMRRRNQEIAGLREALAVLEGEALVQLKRNPVASFLQRRVH